jgi:hypothetical protein
MALRLRRGTNAERLTVVFAEGELIYTTDTKQLYIGDGSTQGGILVSSTDITPFRVEDDENPRLGGDLDLNTYRLQGIGDIDITGSINADVVNGGLFVGDGSGLSNLPEGIIEGSNYRINIVGDDSTVIVNTSDSSITTRNIKATDNTVILESSNNAETNLIVSSIDNRSRLVLRRTSESTIADSSFLGTIFFSKLDPEVGGISTALIGASTNVLAFGIDETGVLSNPSNFFTFTKLGNFGVGTFEALKKVEIKNGSIYLNDTRSILDIEDPLAGEIAYDITDNTLNFFDGLDWRQVIASIKLDGVTEVPGPIKLASISEITKESYGTDSLDITGAIIYNESVDRFEFFQAGSWVSLPNQDLSETGDVVFNSVTATTFIGAGAGTLELQSDTDILINAANDVEIDATNLRVKNRTRVEDRLELGASSSSPTADFVPFSVTAPIYGLIGGQGQEVDGDNYVKTVMKRRLDRYTSGGEILLALNDDAQRFLVKKFLFHNAGSNTFVVTEIGTSGEATLFDSCQVVYDSETSEISVVVRVPIASFSEDFMQATGQITYTANPLFVTVGGY